MHSLDAHDKLPSTLWETRNARHVLETIISQCVHDVKDGLVVYTGDNQGSILSCRAYSHPVWPLGSRWLSGLMPGM